MAGTTTHPDAFRKKVSDLVRSDLSTAAVLAFRTTGTANARGTVVATLPMANPVGAAASASGLLTFTAPTSDTNAAGGTIATATFDITSGGTTVVHCTVGTSGDAINVATGGLVVTAGDTVSCSALSYQSMP